jgi:acyl carrier protein
VAGNRYAEALSDHLRVKRELNMRCVSWGLWQDTGLNRDNPYADAVRQRGVLSLPPTECALLNRLVLRQDPGNYLVGVDAAAEHMGRLTRSTERLALEQPVVVLPSGARVSDELPALDDPFGVAIPLTTVVEQAPSAGPVGEPDAALAREIEEVFRTVVPDGVSRRRQFHELGLASIQVLQLHARLQSRLGRSIPQTALYQYPNLDALIAYLSTS